MTTSRFGRKKKLGNYRKELRRKLRLLRLKQAYRKASYAYTHSTGIDDPNWRRIEEGYLRSLDAYKKALGRELEAYEI